MITGCPAEDLRHPFSGSKLCAQRPLDCEPLEASDHVLNLYVPNTQHWVWLLRHGFMDMNAYHYSDALFFM